jgi:hypothetical protein
VKNKSSLGIFYNSIISLALLTVCLTKLYDEIGKKKKRDTAEKRIEKEEQA